MKSLNVQINDDLHKQIKTLSALKQRKIMNLVSEALVDILKKYNYEDKESE